MAEANNVPTLRAHLQAVADKRGPGAKAGAVKVLSGAFSEAERGGIIKISVVSSAAKGIKTAHKPTPGVAKLERKRSLTEDELRELLAQVAADKEAIKHDMVDLVRFLARTGLRIEEALSLKWADLNLESEAPTMRPPGTKTATSNDTMPLPLNVARELQARRERLPKRATFVFPSPAEPLSRKPRDISNLNMRRRRVFARAKFGDESFQWATFHTFRHTMITLALEQGQPATAVQAYARHGNLATTMAYAGRSTKAREVAQALDFDF
ncbi:MAG: tyrosine-type recombinase/integrase [Bifidobacteriaceae bacterium]|nr:tyrosine-type recombinase/integrase [Bifidobacteriaceae bacterium]